MLNHLLYHLVFPDYYSTRIRKPRSDDLGALGNALRGVPNLV